MGGEGEVPPDTALPPFAPTTREAAGSDVALPEPVASLKVAANGGEAALAFQRGHTEH